jgi:hypothetical protein
VFVLVFVRVRARARVLVRAAIKVVSREVQGAGQVLLLSTSILTPDTSAAILTSGATFRACRQISLPEGSLTAWQKGTKEATSSRHTAQHSNAMSTVRSRGRNQAGKHWFAQKLYYLRAGTRAMKMSLPDAAEERPRPRRRRRAAQRQEAEPGSVTSRASAHQAPTEAARHGCGGKVG